MYFRLKLFSFSFKLVIFRPPWACSLYPLPPIQQPLQLFQNCFHFVAHWHSSNTPFIRPDRKNATRLGSAGDVNVSHQSSTREIVKSVELSSDKNRRGFGQNPFSRPRRNNMNEIVTQKAYCQSTNVC